MNWIKVCVIFGSVCIGAGIMKVEELLGWVSYGWVDTIILLLFSFGVLLFAFLKNKYGNYENEKVECGS